jgi:hypothetical protein
MTLKDFIEFLTAIVEQDSSAGEKVVVNESYEKFVATTTTEKEIVLLSENSGKYD